MEKFEKLFNFKTNANELKDDNNVNKDNRFFKDDNSSQKLTVTDINKIKEDGLTTKGLSYLFCYFMFVILIIIFFNNRNN